MTLIYTFLLYQKKLFVNSPVREGTQRRTLHRHLANPSNYIENAMQLQPRHEGKTTNKEKPDNGTQIAPV